MARLRVTGYINTDDLEQEEVDLDHFTGLTTEGFERLHGELNLDDLRISVVHD